MAESTTVCQYHHYGHCKFGVLCRKKHEAETCTSFPCNKDSCMKRHPKVCRYFTLAGACKFRDECSFLHLTSPTTRINELEEEIKHLQGLFTSISEDVLKINAQTTALEIERKSISYPRILQLDGQFDSTTVPSLKCDRCGSMFDQIEIYINHVLSHVLAGNEPFDERMSALEARIQEVHDTNYILLHSVDDLENDVKILKMNTNCQTYLFRCDICGQSFEKKSYWREHVKNQHYN